MPQYRGISYDVHWTVERGGWATVEPFEYAAENHYDLVGLANHLQRAVAEHARDAAVQHYDWTAILGLVDYSMVEAQQGYEYTYSTYSPKVRGLPGGLTVGAPWLGLRQGARSGVVFMLGRAGFTSNHVRDLPSSMPHDDIVQAARDHFAMGAEDYLVERALEQDPALPEVLYRAAAYQAAPKLAAAIPQVTKVPYTSIKRRLGNWGAGTVGKHIQVVAIDLYDNTDTPMPVCAAVMLRLPEGTSRTPNDLWAHLQEQGIVDDLHLNRLTPTFLPRQADSLNYGPSDKAVYATLTPDLFDEDALAWLGMQADRIDRVGKRVRRNWRVA